MARKIALGPGSECACDPRGVGDLSLKAARKTLVVHLDRLNDILRSLMQKIDQAVPDEKKDRITEPAALRKILRTVACSVDCLVHQFPEATDALWAYLDVAARFGDMAHRTVLRLAAPPGNRPTTPSIARLTRVFNRVARASNESIGLTLLVRRTSLVQVDVDASSFKSKVRRWREKLRQTLSAFSNRWLPLVQRTKPHGPALSQPLRLRVGLARLRQRLHDLAGQAQAVDCKRGANCKKPQSAWVAVRRSLGALDAHLKLLAKQLRGQGPTPTVSAGRRLSASTSQAMAVLQKATLSL